MRYVEIRAYSMRGVNEIGLPFGQSGVVGCGGRIFNKIAHVQVDIGGADYGPNGSGRFHNMSVSVIGGDGSGSGCSFAGAQELIAGQTLRTFPQLGGQHARRAVHFDRIVSR